MTSPRPPDLIIQNDGERTPLEAVEEIERVLYPNIVENPIDNRDYWNRYYQDGLCPMDPSPPLPGMPPLWWNRDGPWWTWAAATGGTPSTLPPWASLSSPLTCQTRPFRRCGSGAGDNPRFLCGDFINAPIHRPASYDYAYSRFTIHAINQQQERMLLLAMHRAIKPGGKFFIEVRGVHDPLYGRGQPQEKKRVLLQQSLPTLHRHGGADRLSAGGGVPREYAQERTGFAPYGNDDPPVIRIVAIRKEMKA